MLFAVVEDDLFGIDPLVPFCGDYNGADCWTEHEKKKYHLFLEKRKKLEDPDVYRL